MVKLNNTILEDLKCASHSNIPWCCRLYYFLVYRPRFYSKKFRERYELYQMACSAPPVYIACKKCLIKNRIIVPKPCICFYRKFGLGYLAPLKFDIYKHEHYDEYHFYSKFNVIKRWAYKAPLF